jgi:hypothetical protein
VLFTREDRHEIGRDYREVVDRYLRESAASAAKAAWRIERASVERMTREQIEKASHPDMARVHALLKAQREIMRKKVTDAARERLRDVCRSAKRDLIAGVDKRIRVIRSRILVTQVMAGATLLLVAVTWLAQLGGGHP